MLKPIALSLSIFAFSTHAAFAQQQSIDCDDPNNAAEDVCLGLPIGSGVTNFAPLIPLLGVLAAVTIGSGGGGSAPSTSN